MAPIENSHLISASEASRSNDKALSVSALRSSAKRNHSKQLAQTFPRSQPSTACRVLSGKVSSTIRLVASDAAQGRGTLPATKQTPSLSNHTSSASSSSDTPETPPCAATPSSSNGCSSKSPPSLVHVDQRRVKAPGRQQLTQSAPATRTTMLEDGFYLPPANGSTPSGSRSRANRILGPDGKLYSQGEAAKLGLIIRAACEACRNRKLKCSGAMPENGGCERCSSDDTQCVYTARAPIGRPKKRKTEDGRETLLSVSPVKSSKAQGKSKRKPSTSGSHTNDPAKVKSEEEYSDQLLQQQTFQKECSADREVPHSFDLYGSPMEAIQHPTPISSKLVSTPTVWSQNHASLATTPSDTMTPQSVLSSSFSATLQSGGHASRGSEAEVSTSGFAAEKLPSLDDLSVAAFLQSLDTLEISPAELFQQQQQMQLLASSSSASTYPNPYRLGAPFVATQAGTAPPVNQLTASSVQEWATSSAILQPGLSFAVPADFSWWDLGINGVGSDAGSAAVSIPATPSTEPSSMSFLGLSEAIATQGHPGASAARRSRRPTFSTDVSWPRGADAGMGQGQISHTVAATETGLGWSTLPGHSNFSETSASPIEDQGMAKGENSSCCSSRPAKATPLLPAQVKDDQRAGKRDSSCSAKADEESPCKEDESALCCTGKTASGKTKAAKLLQASTEAVKSCCSGHTTDPVKAASATASPPDSSERIEMGPLSTSAAVNGNAAMLLDPEHTRHAAVHSQHPSKVHCVPNPSGKGCTCLCDMSVALLSVKQVLRETDPHKSSSNNFATDTIQLTLTASQAITAQCACSTDCPTCQSDPSTEISASLLVSTALQIYARAVRILREGFAASAMGNGSAVQSFFGGLDVTIGSYKPSTSNAKKIALFAIKLELKDLRRALGRVSSMAQNFGQRGTKEESDEGTAPEAREKERAAMNPIDQLVILKLYRQLTELLKTVEGLEDAA